MSKQPIRTVVAPPSTAAKPVPKPVALRARASFDAASFGNLRAALGEGQGEALRLLLADIIEDPDQPRTAFDKDALDSLAESIKLQGVVQPIVVRPPVDGRYMLAFGARRFRASKLAGVKDIPAMIRAPSNGDFAAQVIENQQRAELSNSDLARSIQRLTSEGHNNKQIAAICSLKDYQVAAFKQAGNFPVQLRDRIDSGDMRALYDLFRQWGKTPTEVIDVLPALDTYITVTEARRIIGSITGKPTGSIVLERQRAAAPAAPKSSGEGPRATVSVTPSFIIQGKGATRGTLVVDRKAEREGWALVRFPTGIEEVALDEVRIVRIE